MDSIKSVIAEIASGMEQLQLHQRQQQSTSSAATANTIAGTAADKDGKRKKTKLLKRRGKFERDQQNNLDEGAAPGNNERGNERRTRRNQRARDFKDQEKTLPTKLNDDSTTQAADPSSEDKIEGDDGDRVKRVLRRKKQHFNKRGYYNDRRNRMDSSERNSNDTSPQNEVNGDNYRRSAKPRNGHKKSYPELSEAELNELFQVMKRDFFASEIGNVKKAIHDKGPRVAKEFASAILDHAICDVTSPTKISEIATNLSQILVSDESGNEFQSALCSALTDISKREDDIAIDAPRYMDTLGQVLGECVVPMNTNRNRQLLRRFLTKSLQSYGQQSRALLLASTMKGIAGRKDERFAKDIWDLANLSWSNFLKEGENLDEFLESQDVKFTTKTFSPEPRRTRKTSAEMEKFADDVTDLVEKRCTTQRLDELVKDLELEPEEMNDYLGQLIYAIVRGCLINDSGEHKLDTEALNKYSSLMRNQKFKKEEQDAIALNALTALTKLWHQHNCPQNLMSNILLALNTNGTASYDALKTWLNAEDLKNVPGIGAARLNSKRFIEDLGAVRG